MFRGIFVISCIFFFIRFLIYNIPVVIFTRKNIIYFIHGDLYLLVRYRLLRLNL